MIYEPLHIELFKEKAQLWASSFSTVCIFNSNEYKDPYGSISLMIAVGSDSECRLGFPSSSATNLPNNAQKLEKLQYFIDQHAGKIIPGYITYDFDAYFFVPNYILRFNGDQVEITAKHPAQLVDDIESIELKKESIGFNGSIRPRMSRKEYTAAFNKLREHILQGDIYEVNLCQEFYAENADLNGFAAYKELNAISPTPFSCFLRDGQKVIISASPERFLAKKGSKLISQPIKGTAPRGDNQREDEEIKRRLKNDPKEISENIMIVDLVRNDLTRSALPGTVKVEELLGLYTFRQVHQLISTISCTIKPDLSVSEAIENTFPPGSMTGAPKISAMKLIDQYEKGNRGLYAGAIGYFNDSNDFDFNVVIRTLLYDSKTKYLSFHVGGAVTAKANEEDEYRECLLKASAIIKLLS